MLARLAQDYRVQWDLTQNRRHTLSRPTLDVLGRMQGPVTITAYATEQDPELGDIRKIIRDFVEPYRRAKPDLTLRIVDPRDGTGVGRAVIFRVVEPRSFVLNSSFAF